MNARQRLAVVGGVAALLALAIYPPFVRESGNIAADLLATTSIGHRFLWQTHSEPPVYIDYAVTYRPDFLWLALEWTLVALLAASGVWILRGKELQAGRTT